MPDQIFISYRRDDAAYVTGHINDLLRKEFGDEAVFTDVDNIALGVDFRVVIDKTVSQCQVFLAVIGSGWLAARDQEGNQRLTDPADFVRIEIESALKRNIPVIPLLVSGAVMPAPEDLPESLRNLAYRNGTPIRPAPDFTADMARLIKNLRQHFDQVRKSRGEVPTAQAEPAPAPAEPVTEPGKTSKTDEAPAVQMHVAADERARKQAELGIGDDKKRRWTTPLWLSAIVIGALGGWFYVDRNPEILQGLLAGSPATDSAAEAEIESIGNTAPDSTIGIVGTEATADAPAPDLLPEESIGASEEPGEIDVPADPGAKPVVNEESLVDGQVDASVAAETADVAEAPAEPTIENAPASASAETNTETTAEATDQPEVAEQAVAETATESPANSEPTPASDADGEVTLTPGSQRQSDASTLISEGFRLAGVGDHEGAIQLFSEAIPLNVEPAFVYKQRGASYQALGQYEAAIQDYDQAIELTTEDPIIFYNRGISHYALQNYDAAIADYDAVIQFDPEFVDAYSRRADAHEANGDTAAATRDRAVVSVFESNQDNQR